MRRFRGVGFLVAVITVLAVASDARADPPITVHAVRGTPTLDGRLDDEAWSRAPWTPDFVQRTPQLGAHAAHRTRARVLYDDHALYVAVECQTAQRPQARLARRDNIPLGEWARVMIDTRGEGESAFSFSVNPAGVQSDATIQGDYDYDAAWDAVWEAEVQRSEHGWTAEFRIPWEVLRFDAGHLVFRIQIDRYAYQDGETVALVPITQDAPHFVANFAPLTGIANIRPHRIFQLQPYTVGRYRILSDPSLLDPTPTFSGSIGGDIKLGITHDLVVDATINPDFGQVEVDPTVINLTTYETFFPERRPFFLEGTDLFNTPLRLLHTRRIGAAPPSSAPLDPDGVVTEIQPVAPIWGAAKVSGRAGPLSFLLLDAVTGPASQLEQYPGAHGPVTVERTIAPATNWFAARVRGSVGSGSTIGAMFTNVARLGLEQPADTVGSVDWDFRAPDGVHRFRGQFVATDAWNPTQGVHSGEGLFLEAQRAEDPAWTWSLRARVYSHDFDPNGLGYLDRPDLVRLVYDTTFRSRRPHGAVRSFYVNPWVWRSANTEGLVTDQGTGIELYLMAQNEWSMGAGVRGSTEYFDDRETRGGLPWWNPPSAGGWAWITSDPRLPLRGYLEGDASTQYGGSRTNTSLTITWNPIAAVALSGTASLHLVDNVPRWVANVMDPGGSMLSIFGQQRTLISDNSVHASVAFSRRLTFDLFSQLLAASIRYEDYRALVTPYQLQRYAYGSSASYDDVSLTINAVGRYEYRPGSFVTVVLVHRQSLTSAPGDPGYGAGFSALGNASPDTTLMAKVTYLYY